MEAVNIKILLKDLKTSNMFVQNNNPFKCTPCGRRRNYMQLEEESPLKDKKSRSERKEFRVERAAERRSKKGKEPRRTTKGKGRNFRTVEEGAGMTAKGVASYKAKNPGSKLQTAVTGDVKPGSKAAKRRKSFCARSKGWTGERGKAARRRWKC